MVEHAVQHCVQHYVQGAVQDQAAGALDEPGLGAATSAILQMQENRLKEYGGDEGSRTPDLCIANATLYQLSYVPTHAPDGAYQDGRDTVGAATPVRAAFFGSQEQLPVPGDLPGPRGVLSR